MRMLLWITSVWPGFVQAWLAAKWEGLVLAIAFAAALNGALLTTFVWPEWPGGNSPAGASAVVSWLIVLGLGFGGIVWLRRDGSLIRGARSGLDPELEAWFGEAQHEYLRGHWIEAEGLIRRMLSRRPDDAEAGLLLAAIQRRTRLLGEARKTLARLQANPAAAAWKLEIDCEMRQLAELEEEGRTEDADERSLAA